MVCQEFNDTDLETSSLVLRMFLDEQDTIPWGALLYVTGQINYGGRVTDDWDRRCLMTILGQFYSDKILQDDYVFSESGVYHATPEGTLQSVREYLEELPLTDPPEIFGMNENANITFQKQETENIMETVLSIQPRAVDGGGGKTSDERVADIAIAIYDDTPTNLNKDEARRTGAIVNGVTDSLTIVLLQEMDRFNRLLNVMRKTLKSLQAAIRGEVVMSGDLDRMYSSLLNNQVPAQWTKVAYPSLKPLASWVKDLIERIAFMRTWSENGRPNSFWMSGFFFPQGFMTGALQNHARKYQIPIDSLNFTFKVMDQWYKPEEVTEKPEDGIYIYGLFLDSARWDNSSHMLADSNLGQLYADMPVIHFMPAINPVRDPVNYECPVYKTHVRAGVLSTTGQSTNFVLPVELPTDKPPVYWVQKGVALLCALNN